MAVTALLAAMLGAWVGWQRAGDLPTDAEMRSLTAVMTAGAAPLGVERFTGDASQPVLLVLGTDEYTPGFVEATLPGGVTDLAPLAGRLEAAGWRTGTIETTEWAGVTGSEFTAAQGDWRLVVQSGNRARQPTVAVERAVPALALVLSALAALVGAALGEGLSRLARGGLAPLGTAGFLLLSANSVFVAVALISDVVEFFGTGLFLLPWEFFAATLARPMTLLGLLLVAAWVITEITERRLRPALSDGRY
ncbi:hypothetical protein [Actinoplanes sp. DH11]|uniref:hypothetical protein n=1 Tax=Actinoplanes sp. DH11 TaxID=2857011 RepID=UPI001E486C4D|nr:hypothetical protein [Actinoplanes sp. DH11]